MAWKRKERMMREKGETWKHHQEFSEDKKKKKKINVPFFSSIWFHFPCVALHHRGRGGRGGMQWEGEWERAKERNHSHPQELWTLDKSKHTWYYNRTDLNNTTSSIVFSLSVKISDLTILSCVGCLLYLCASPLIFQYWFSERRLPSILFSNEEFC